MYWLTYAMSLELGRDWNNSIYSDYGVALNQWWTGVGGLIPLFFILLWDIHPKHPLDCAPDAHRAHLLIIEHCSGSLLFPVSFPTPLVVLPRALPAKWTALALSQGLLLREPKKDSLDKLEKCSISLE